MASYKIYFLIFCHKNQPSSEGNGLNKLQNATVKAIFVEKAVLPPHADKLAGVARRGTIAKIYAPSGTSIRAQQQVDQCGHVTDVDAAIVIDIGSL